MTVPLRALAACFEGVIPSILATAAADGTPNVSYLSHVALVDDHHVALPNQFFSETAANVRANPSAMLLLVDPRDGRQYRLEVSFQYAMAEGELFDRMATQLRASSAQIGMSDVMRLREVDVYRVWAVHLDAAPAGTPMPPPDPARRLDAAAAIARRIARAAEVDTIVDILLEELCSRFGATGAMLLVADPGKERLLAVGSRGYTPTGIGAEVGFGEGVIGTAASERRPVRVSDMSRIRRFGRTIRASSDEDRTRIIALPGMPDAMSQLALPMIAQDALRGVIFLESSARLAFTREDEALAAILAAHAAAALALAEGEGDEPQPAGLAARHDRPQAGRTFQVVHHAFDDSVFIDHAYLIKGLPGRLLVHLLALHLRDGRTDFTNREIRLAEALRLPEIKDNLETRLLLLRRRLDEKVAPVRLQRTGRGQVRLALAAHPVLTTVTR